jgi:signal transduction histidine kinase/HPt (histidine-containing phosphotransfer) domain-containing protein
MNEPCILLVEDSPPHATVARYALAAGGVRVEHCVTLAAAIDRLSDTERPALTAVVLDLTLPDSSGVETFDRIAAAGAPPVVVLSANDDPAQALALIERGAQDYLVKGENSGPAIARAVRGAIERGRLREEQHRAREKAEAAARAQRAFVAAMSHEVRTPLNAILGMAELLAQTPLAPEQREYLEIARRCGRALQGLLDNALELSRLEGGGVQVARDPFELESVVQECLEAFAFTAHQKGIALVGDLSDDAIGTVIGDESRLRQVLFNLVGNAVKFTERGRVSVSTRVEPGRVTLRVSDTGIGIPRDRQAAVFERFVQAESGTTRRFGGSGLGLALCREMVRAMEGEIRLESEPQVGSVFEVVLPWITQVRACDATLSERRILTLIADPAERRSLSARLRRRGALVHDAATVADAEQRLGASEPFDAALLDAQLLDGDGIDLLARVGDSAPASMHRIVLLPMNHRVGDLLRCESLSAAALCKPARWSTLERALREGRPAPADAADGPAPSFVGRQILLAEDAPENRVIVQAHLRATGCAVEIAVDGVQVVEKWRHGNFDLVLMDVHMPGVDGCEAARRIRAEERRSGRRPIAIIALSADTLPEQRDDALAAGCDAHLGKPFAQRELFAMLQRFLAPTEPQAARAAEEEEYEVPARIPPDLADLAEEYLMNRRADAVALREAVSTGDFAGARRRGHNMKGSGAGYGFPRVSELGAQIERAAEAGDTAAVERWADALDEYAERQLGLLPQASPPAAGSISR